MSFPIPKNRRLRLLIFDTLEIADFYILIRVATFA